MLIRQTLRYAPAQFLGPLAQFAGFVLWTHMLAPDAYGVVVLIIAAQELGFQLSLFWWTSYTVRYVPVMKERGAYQGCENAVLLITAAVQMLVAYVTLAWIGHANDPALLLSTAIYFATRTPLNHIAERGRAVNDITAYTLAQTVPPLLGLLLGIALMQVLPSAVAVTAGFAIVQSALLPYLIVRLGLGVRPLLKLDRGFLASAFRYGGPLLVAGGLSWLTLNEIRLVVDHLEGTAALGLLSVGWSLGQRLIGVLAMMLSAAAFPLAVRDFEARGLRASLQRLSANGTLLIGLLIPAALGTMAVAAPLTNSLVGEEFRAVTIVVLPIATLAAAIRNIRLHFIDHVFLITEQTRLLLGFNLFEAAATLPFCWIGLKTGGLGGACLGCLAATVVTSLASFAIALLRYDLSVPLSSLVRIAVANVAMVLVAKAPAFPGTVWGLAAQIGGSAVIYGAATLLLFRKTAASFLSDHR